MLFIHIIIHSRYSEREWNTENNMVVSGVSLFSPWTACVSPAYSISAIRQMFCEHSRCKFYRDKNTMRRCCITTKARKASW